MGNIVESKLTVNIMYVYIHIYIYIYTYYEACNPIEYFAGAEAVLRSSRKLEGLIPTLGVCSA